MELLDLRKPFDPDKVSWRIGSTTQDKSRGMALGYIDSRDVQDRLDEVCGIAGWQCRYSLLGKTTICEIGIKVGEEWIWKADGAGDTDVEAEKGALSDSFKRAAVKFGIGRYLYDLDSPWVDIKPSGKSFALTDGAKAHLRNMLANGTRPVASKPLAQSLHASAKTPAPAPPDADRAKLWGQAAIITIKGLDRKGLDAWEEKNNAAIVKLRAAHPETHEKLVAAIRDRYLATETMLAG